MFQVIDLIEFYRKKHHVLTYFLRLFSFPFLYFSQETVFFVYFVQILVKHRFSDVFFVCYVNSDLKTAEGVLPKTYFFRSELKCALVLNFIHVDSISHETNE